MLQMRWKQTEKIFLSIFLLPSGVGLHKCAFAATMLYIKITTFVNTFFIIFPKQVGLLICTLRFQAFLSPL
jgi:hypothetical protein